LCVGAGGGEASVFAEQIFDMCLKYAAASGFAVGSVEKEVPPGSNVGIQVENLFIHVYSSILSLLFTNFENHREKIYF
jgi:protein subunit release factor A